MPVQKKRVINSRTDLSDPVRVEDAEPLEPSSDALLGDGLEVPLRLLLLDGTGGLGLAVRAALGHGALAAAATHGDAVDDEAWLKKDGIL